MKNKFVSLWPVVFFFLVFVLLCGDVYFYSAYKKTFAGGSFFLQAFAFLMIPALILTFLGLFTLLRRNRFFIFVFTALSVLLIIFLTILFASVDLTKNLLNHIFLWVLPLGLFILFIYCFTRSGGKYKGNKPD